MFDTTNDATKEQNVNAVVEAAASAAANWIHSPTAVAALSEATGIAPFFVHIAFLFASMLQHHSQKIGAATPQVAVASTSIPATK